MLEDSTTAELVAAAEWVAALAPVVPAVAAAPVAMAAEALSEALLRLGVSFPGQRDDAQQDPLVLRGQPRI